MTRHLEVARCPSAGTTCNDCVLSERVSPAPIGDGSAMNVYQKGNIRPEQAVVHPPLTEACTKGLGLSRIDLCADEICGNPW